MTTHRSRQPQNEKANRKRVARARTSGLRARRLLVEMLEDRRMLACTPESLTNNSALTADVLTLVEDPVGSGYRTACGIGAIDPATANNQWSDPDYWRFEALAGDRVAIQVATPGSDVNPYFELRNAAEGVLDSDEDSGPGGDAYISYYTIQDSGVYYARVGKNSSSTVAGPYQISVEIARGLDLESDEAYANDSLGGADNLSYRIAGLNYTAKVAGTVMGPEGANQDEDVYVLGVLNPGNVVDLNVQRPAGSTLWPVVRLLNSSGTPVADEDGDTSDLHFHATITSSTTYYAQVYSAWWAYGGHRYMLTPSATWSSAESQAQTLGGHLVTIDDAAEQAWVSQTFSDVGEMWLGLNDAASEGTWRWSSGEPVSYTNWASGQPTSGTYYNGSYLSPSTGQWSAGYHTHTRVGLVELADPGGGPDEAGPGPGAQYVLDVAVTDLVAPRVSGVSRLPAEGGTTETLISTFSMWFSEALTVGTVQAANMDLREAGADGAFDTADDVPYQLAVSYGGSTSASLQIMDGPMGPGHYRLTVREALTDIVGNPLDGDGDGTGGDVWQRTFDVNVPIPPGTVFEGRSNDSRGTATPLPLVESPPDSGYWRGFGIGSQDPAPYAVWWSDPDYWRIEALAGDRLAVAMDSGGSGVDAYVKLLSASGGEVAASDDDGPGTDAYISHYRIPSTGTYYVMAASDPWSTAPGNYSLRVELARGIDLETDQNYDNDELSRADPLTLTQDGNTKRATVAGTVMSSESQNPDEDRFALGLLNAGNVVELNLRQPSGSTLVPVPRVLKSNGTAVTDDDGNTGDGHFRATLSSSDTYYAEVRSATWGAHGGHRYLVTPTSMTWAAAESYAQSLGGHLVTINDASEQAWVYSTFRGFGDLWLGLSDAALEGTWRWANGEAVSYTYWGSGQPNSGTIYNWGYLLSNSGQWYATSSGSTMLALVELPDLGGGPADAGPGPRAQYVLDVALADPVLPKVSYASRLPAEGGTTGTLMSTFSVGFSEPLAAGTVNKLGTWAEYNGHLYVRTYGAMTWAEAETNAVGLGGHLVTIDDAAEQAWVFQQFGSSQPWIGMNDAAVEGTWVWSSGAAATYTNWYSGQPTSATSYNGAYLRSDNNGKWNADSTTAARAGLIELGAAPDADGNGVPDVLEGRDWDLREAGPDGTFDTADDVPYQVLVYPPYNSGTTVSLLISDGPMATGHYRVTSGATITDLVGNALDGNGDGTGGDVWQRTFDVNVPIPPGTVFEGRSNDSRGAATALPLVESPPDSGYWRGFGIGSQDPGWSEPWSDPDYWRIEAQAGDRLAVAVDTGGNGLNAYVELQNAGGSYLDVDDNGGPDYDAYISDYKIVSSGTYYVVVGHRSSTLGNYALRVELARGIDLESDRSYDNDELSRADPLTLTQDGNTKRATVAGTVMSSESQNQDEDRFALGLLNAGNVVELNLRQPAGSTLAGC